MEKEAEEKREEPEEVEAKGRRRKREGLHGRRRQLKEDHSIACGLEGAAAEPVAAAAAADSDEAADDADADDEDVVGICQWEAPVALCSASVLGAAYGEVWEGAKYCSSVAPDRRVTVSSTEHKCST